MAYTSRKAVEVIEGYFNEINASYELIDNSKKRGFLVQIDDASKIVIFVSPLVHKVDGTKNYFDTRDSAPDARELVWNYAQKNNYKFFHLGINDEVPKYKDYIFSLEADEDYVQKFSGTEHGERVGPGNQIIIPNDRIFTKNFERIQNKKDIYISVIHKSSLKEYLTFYDNRPYAGTDIPDKNDSNIDLPSSARACAGEIMEYIYSLDSFERLREVLKANTATIRVLPEKLSQLNLPTNVLNELFNLPASTNYNNTDGRKRVFDKVYNIPTVDAVYQGKLSTEWRDNPLNDDSSGNSLAALIKVVNEYYSDCFEIVKTENGYCLKIKKETTKGSIPSTNVLLYGVPGCGKSFYVEKNYESKVQEGFTIRVVFHPDYTYSDFVGQVMPILKTIPNEQGEDEKKLQYEFIPGPFTKILQTAYSEPDQQCLLIIEELNRGNAPAIFGEIFQLLDRYDNGESKYGIYNADIAKYAYKELQKYDGWEEEAVAKESIKLPSNLTIVATMNTSDQNVFTMDTAFQRRWQMKHIPNRFTGESLDEKTINHVAKHLPNSEISWGVFAQTINKKMHTANLGFGGTEDKSLGVYFATDNDLDDAERFAEKVLKYLWDDAFKLGRKELFNDCSQGLSAVIEAYEDAAKAKIEKQSAEDPLKKVLVPEVYNEMQKKMAEMAAEQAQTAEEKTSEDEAAESAAEDNPAQEPAGEE